MHAYCAREVLNSLKVSTNGRLFLALLLPHVVIARLYHFFFFCLADSVIMCSDFLLFFLFIFFLDGHAPWLGSGSTFLAIACHPRLARTQAARLTNSVRGATVIAGACGQRKTTPAASSRKTSPDSSMSSTRSARFY